MSETVVAVPALTFQLLGSWDRVVLGDDAVMFASIREYVAARVGTADADAQARSLLRTRLAEAFTAARDAGGVSALIASEITPGTPMPVMITIYAPRTLRMTPAIGTSATAVAGMLREGLTQLGIEGVENATELSIEGSTVLRIVREQVDSVHPDVPDREVTSLIADYWYSVPESKQVVLANFSTPLSDIPEIMLSFFDATVRASYFAQPAGASAAP